MTQSLMPVPASNSLVCFRQSVAPSSFSLRLPPPHPQLQVCVVVPARNEESELPHLVAALAGQVGLDGLPLNPGVFEIIILLNNCIDRSAAVVRNLRPPSSLKLHIAEITFEAHEAHVGRARQTLFDTAYD